MKLSRVSEGDLRAWRARVDDKDMRAALARAVEDTMAKNTIQHDQKIQAKRERDARVKREKRAAAKAEVERILDEPLVQVATPGARPTKTTTSGGAFDPDEPIPVRLTLTGLAEAFEDACSEVAIQEGVLDYALQLRAKARKALDNAADRLANGDA